MFPLVITKHIDSMHSVCGKIFYPIVFQYSNGHTERFEHAVAYTSTSPLIRRLVKAIYLKHIGLHNAFIVDDGIILFAPDVYGTTFCKESWVCFR